MIESADSLAGRFEYIKGGLLSLDRQRRELPGTAFDGSIVSFPEEMVNEFSLSIRRAQSSLKALGAPDAIFDELNRLLDTLGYVNTAVSTGLTTQRFADANTEVFQKAAEFVDIVVELKRLDLAQHDNLME